MIAAPAETSAPELRWHRPGPTGSTGRDMLAASRGATMGLAFVLTPAMASLAAWLSLAIGTGAESRATERPRAPVAPQVVRPPAAYSVGAAFDVRRGRLVLFGGYQPGSGELGQTWEWDEDRWSRASVPGPSPRNGPAMAYDKRCGVVVLFGGDRAGLELGDTWTWDGSAWRRVATAGPSPRSLARAEYDPGLGRIVLFGGIADDVVLSDAWEW